MSSIQMTHTNPNPDFYTAGGTLPTEAPSYVPRLADQQLRDAIHQHKFCYILTSRQMGKSSLMARAAERLRTQGFRSAVVDLSSIGATNEPAERWYLGQINHILQTIGLRFDYFDWWAQQSHLTIVQRFTEFLIKIVLHRVREPVVIFVDEIDTTLRLSYSDDYFAAIRALYNGRATNPVLNRLIFVLLGVASPSDLIKDSTRTPFNIGMRISLTDFELEEAKPLTIGLAPDPTLAAQLLERVIFWTGGHPFLTQETCTRVARWAASPQWNPADVPLVVDDLVQEVFLSEAGRNTNDNLRFVRKAILGSTRPERLLQFYRRIRRGEAINDNELDPIPVALKLSGLVKPTDAGTLKVRNLIYERVFDEAWIRASLAEHHPAVQHEPAYRYDVFISYSNRDREWVISYLLPQLEASGLKVIVDERDFEIGLPRLVNIERAFDQSRWTLLVLTPAWVASEWSEFESLLSSSNDPAGRQRRLLPLLLTPTDIPRRLAILTLIDFTGDKPEKQMPRLLRSLGAPQPILANADAPTTAREVNLRSSGATQYDTYVVRNLLAEAFADKDDLTAFLYDFFPTVHAQASGEASVKKKIQLLIEYASQHDAFDTLLDQVARAYPRQYRRYADRLQRGG